PAAAVGYWVSISVPFSRPALALSVLLALMACLCAATAIGQLAKLEPSAGGLYAYAAHSLGPWAGFNVAWLFILFEPLVAPFLYLEFGWAMREVMSSEAGWHWSGQWGIWSGLQQLRRPAARRRALACARQDVLGRRLGARIPRDLQLARRELERGGQRGDACLLRTGTQPAGAAAARAHPSGVQDAVRR